VNYLVGSKFRLKGKVVGIVIWRWTTGVGHAPSSAVAFPVSVAAVGLVLATPTKHLHLGCRNFERIPGLAISVGITSASQTAFNVYLLTSSQILIAYFRQSAKRTYIEPFGLFPLLSIRSSISAVGGDAE
jgi:hypothetical protein